MLIGFGCQKYNCSKVGVDLGFLENRTKFMTQDTGQLIEKAKFICNYENLIRCKNQTFCVRSCEYDGYYQDSAFVQYYYSDGGYLGRCNTNTNKCFVALCNTWV